MKSFYPTLFPSLVFFLLMVVQHIACNLQQRVSKRQDMEVRLQQEIIRSDSFNLDWRAEHFYINSESSRIQAVVIPEGVFQYSPELGYTGRASKVMIQQSHNQQELNRDSNRLLWTAVDKAAIHTKQKVVHNQRERVKVPVGEWKVLLSLLFVLVLAVFLFRYLKSR